jgi:hypothetical protein
MQYKTVLDAKFQHTFTQFVAFLSHIPKWDQFMPVNKQNQLQLIKKSTFDFEWNCLFCWEEISH